MTTFVSFQYYRQARVKALQLTYPDYKPDDVNGARGTSFRYPRPISEPPSPSLSRHTTPTPSERNSDNEDEEDEVNDEHELEELKLASFNG